ENEDWAYVAVQDGKVRSCLAFFASERNVIRGNPIRFAGVWGVATEPHYRKKGMLREIYEKVFPRMHKEGIVLSILDPFFPPFYEKFGYACAESRMKHTFKHDNLRKVKGKSDISTREIEDVSEAEKVYEVQKSMARFGSRVFFMKRTLESKIKSSHYHILERKGEPVGEIKFHFKKRSGWTPDLRIDTTSYTSLDVFPSIVELVSQYSINVNEVEWYCDPEVPVSYYMKDIEDAPKTPVGRMMMRVINFTEYCANIRVPEAAAKPVIVEIVDDDCEWNSGVYRLTPTSGTLEAEIVTSQPEIKLDALQLSKTISGLTPPTLLHGLGSIDCSRSTAENLESIFPAESFVSYIRF
ncbi:MAG: enhanced intracellular survival protein Eis, partial [Candidatus Thorarchaeota archaeon]